MVSVLSVLVTLVAAIAALTATFDTFTLVRDHLVYNRKESLRKYIIRIILMVPAYSISALGGIMYKDSCIYFDTARECYEAFVIYSFLQFLIEFLGGDDVLPGKLAEKEPQYHLFPLCMMRSWEMGNEFFENVKIGTLQYVVVKPILAWMSFALHQNGLYDAGNFRIDRGYLWITIVTNMSQVWAMYCLALFYFACKTDLAPLRPMGKFMVVKAVVFFTWWQSVVLAFLVRVDWIHRSGDYSVEDVVNSTQNFLICLEMLGAAMAHRHTFPVRDFRQLFSDRNNTRSTVKSIFDAVNVTDVFVRDVWEAGSKLKDRAAQIRSGLPAGTKFGDVEMSPLIYRWDQEECHLPQPRPDS